MACLTPYRLSDERGGHLVPCGKCPKCRARRTSNWSFRLQEHDKIVTNSHFITLTYATEHVPITPNGFMTINKRDCQLFMKRLRKGNSKQLKYYLCGEYGSKTNRPHYHLILFNAEIDTIQNAWQLGSVHYGQVSGASVGYTLKYINKLGKIPIHRNDDRVPEFQLMSKGLGANYLTDNMVKWHLADKLERMYINLPDGKKAAMPRYYKNKIYTEFDRLQYRDNLLNKFELEYQELTEDQKTRKDQQIIAAFDIMHTAHKKTDKF